MKHIWAPWRMGYILSARKGGCFLCEKLKEHRDEENYILFRGRTSFVLLNLYPYNPGHLMVAPYRHVPSLEDLSEEELVEHFKLVALGVSKLKEAFGPDGFNIGLNLGKAAGAGVAGHLHTHVVPRWEGDTNFMPVISDVKVIPQALNETYGKLRRMFEGAGLDY